MERNIDISSYRRFVLVAIVFLVASVRNPFIANASIVYDFVNYPVDQADSYNPGTDTISGTIITNGAIGVQTDSSNFVGGTLTITTPIGTYSTSSLDFFASSTASFCELTSTQILVPQGYDFRINFNTADNGFSGGTLVYNRRPTETDYFAVLTEPPAPGIPAAGWASPTSNVPGSIGSSDPWVVATAASSSVPEPSTLIVWSLLGTLAFAIGWWRKRKAG